MKVHDRVFLLLLYDLDSILDRCNAKRSKDRFDVSREKGFECSSSAEVVVQAVVRASEFDRTVVFLLLQTLHLLELTLLEVLEGTLGSLLDTLETRRGK